MLVELGHFATVLALGVALVQMLVPAWGYWQKDDRLMGIAIPSAIVQFLLLLLAFGILVHSFIVSDFSVSNVAVNSHSAKPMLYKISGAWGNHEGSMLLWVLILALFGALVAAFGNNLPKELKSNVLSVQGSIGVAFLLFIVLTSNPFTRLDPVPVDGNGLNPILQDPALAFHPPFLYVGYVGFSMAFSFAVAALIDGRIDAAWARWVRPWTLTAWMFLTVGIAMGSWWAYYELGWGGWWFWDPVENASFMPWLSGTALLHSAMVMEKRDSLKIWTILLAILTFSLSLMGAFLVRSGVLTSVHAFAVDPDRGILLLLIMFIFIGGALSLFFFRASTLRNGGIFSPVSREGSLVLNNLILVVACLAVLVGTLYPLVYEAISGGEKLSVGAPFFDFVFGWLMVPLLIALPFGPFLPWKRGDLLKALERLKMALILGVIVAIYIAATHEKGLQLAVLGMAIGVWLIVGSLADVAFRVKLFRASFEETVRRMINLPRSVYGTAIAHLGVGVCVLGVVATSAWRVEKVVEMKPGDNVEIAGYNVVFKGVSPGRGENYAELTGQFSVRQGGVEVLTLNPSKRAYNVPRQTTSEAGIYPTMGGDLYAVLGDTLQNGAYSVRLYFNPLVRFIWIGALIMFFGGLMSLTDRRLRVGAPKKAVPKGAIPAAAE